MQTSELMFVCWCHSPVVVVITQCLHRACTEYVEVSGPSVKVTTMVCSGCLHCSPIQCLKGNSYSLYCYINTYNMHDSNLMTICPCTVITNSVHAIIFDKCTFLLW